MNNNDIVINVMIFNIMNDILIRHDNVIDWMIKVMGRIIFNTTLWWPHDSVHHQVKI